MNPANGQAPLELTPAMVSGIHTLGGTVLGTSRGPVDPKIMVEFLRERGVGILFPIGGDGTQRGALAIFEEARRQGHELAVVGIPKTIDNDILYVSRTFGYLTAIGEARQVIDSAHTEARGVFNGIGLVRLMGRHSGFIAAGAALASGDVNFVLIPEVPFRLEGEHGFLNVLEKRLAAKSHAVVVVAEGAGQELIERRTAERDASGNERLADIGVFLRERIVEYFGQRRIPVNVRYIDPSYVIRSKPVSSDDAILCDWLARGAAHAGMAGKTGLVIGFLHGATLHVPMEMVAAGRQHVDPGGPAWRSVLASTGQPARFE
jgi:6-phosphofructokinase 1